MKSKVHYIALFSLLSVFLFAFYAKLILNPNEYLFTNTGDGLKNYYTFNAFVKNNESFIDFNQMNYPFGEVFLFIDCQPFLSSCTKAIASIFPAVANNSTAVLNLFLILNFYLACWISFKLLKHLTKNNWLSVFGSLAIVLFSPQVVRLNGHYSLSYSFFILFTFYDLIKYNFQYPGTKRAIAPALIILIAFFTHAYLGLICSGIILAYWLGLHLLKIFPFSLKTTISAIGISLVPLLVFYIFSVLIDSHTGRTDNPFGILHYHSNLESIFLPNFGETADLAKGFFPTMAPIQEGYAYIGIIGILTTVLFIGLFISSVFSKKVRSIFSPNKNLMAMLLVSLVFLFLALLPSLNLGAEKWIGKIPLVKQFRSIGRFAWVFYYLVSIGSIYLTGLIFNYLINKKKTIVAYSIMLLVPLIYVSESLALHHNVAYKVPIVPSKFEYENLDAGFQKMIEMADPKKYQAFLSVPYFVVGSENFELYREELNNDFAFLFNYHTQIPMFSYMSGRTSIWESKKHMQLFSSPFYTKTIKEDLPNGKDILMVFEKSQVREQELAWVNRTKKLYEDEKWYLGEIDTANFFYQTNQDELAYFEQHKDEYTLKNGFLVNNPTSYFKYNKFGFTQEISFSSNSYSLEIDDDLFTLLAILKQDEIQLGKEYIARYWIYNDGENYGQDMAKGLTFFDKAYDNQSHWLAPIYKPLSSFDIQGNWSLVELKFTYTEPMADHLLIFNKNYIGDNKTYIKDLLIYEKGLLIYKEYEVNGQKYLFKNNHRIRI